MFVMWAMQREGAAGNPGDGIAGGVEMVCMPVRELLADSKRYVGQACSVARVLHSADSTASCLRVEDCGGRTGAARGVITPSYRDVAAIHGTRGLEVSLTEGANGKL